MGEGRGGGEEGAAVGAHVERRVLLVGGEVAHAVLFVEESVGGGGGGGCDGGGFLRIGLEMSLRGVIEKRYGNGVGVT